jgi:hypothetical protein
VLVRLLGVLVLGVVVGVVTMGYRRRSAADAGLRASTTSGTRWPSLPLELRVDSVPCTWVIFTTPLCVSCGHVRSELERAFPHHAVTTVDATERPDLADPYSVRRAPTAVLADHDGHVIDRLVGPEAVRAFIGTSAERAGLTEDH